MAKIVKIKNNSGATGTWVGQDIADGAYYQLQIVEIPKWFDDSTVFTDVGNGNLVVNNGADTTDDFTDVVAAWNWLSAQDNQLDSATGKHTIHESSRPQIPGKSFHTYWTGAGDDISTPDIGQGPLLAVDVLSGDATKEVDVQFHKDFGDVYLHEGYVQWENAGWGDCICVEVHATATPLQQSVNLDYTIDESIKIRAASGGPGTGTDGLNGDPVWVPNPAGTGWWDTDGVTATFNATQTGAYDWYTIEILANRFMNMIPVYGSSSNYVMLQSADTTLLPSGYLVRVKAINNSSTAWRAWVFMTLYRENTV